jgi:ATP-dependent exoDNAse (exonuclease V) beta subunit
VVRVLTLYRSSAGSGKTRTLAKVFLRLALSQRADYFRHILAVTFTNKATQEMKGRIIKYLDEFSRGIRNDLEEELRQELQLDQATFRERSQELLRRMLHQYSDFSVSTIDAFFQRVIRAFTREAGLAGDYRLIVDTQEVLDEVVQNLLEEAGTNNQLATWLTEMAIHLLEQESEIDITKELKNFASLLLEDDFKRIETELTRPNANELTSLLKELNSIRNSFIQKLIGYVKDIDQWMEAQNLTCNDFKGKTRGSVYTWVKKAQKAKQVADFSEEKLGGNWRDKYAQPGDWAAADSAHQSLITQYAAQQGVNKIKEFVRYRDRTYRKALSAEIILQNLYLLGLTNYLLEQFARYRQQHRAMLLAEAPLFLQRIINDSETPFIYEKVGSFYRHFLIDEFQDTSSLQWRNLRPLVVNALDQGYESMVVGDVKQAIYRWRGGDLNLLHREIAEQIGTPYIAEQNLKANYRSARNIVEFNNDFFSQASQAVAQYVNAALPQDVFYSSAQETTISEAGIVQVTFIESTRSNNPWKIQALAHLCTIIEELQQQGVPPRDIAILVRKNDEGQEIINHLIAHQQSSQAKPGVQYQVVSSESLRIDSAASVNLLLHAMRYLHNPDDVIARAGISFEYNRIHHQRPLHQVMQVTAKNNFFQNLPPDFERQQHFLRALPLYEMTESLISLFNLHSLTGEIAYLQAFQDVVLHFSLREQNELGEFLSWWEEARHTDKATIKSPADCNAIQLLTIHKAKGLQFPYVIIPFCSWNLDSRNVVLWAKPEDDDPPFGKLGVLPVNYKKILSDSCFSQAYQQERINAYVDNLNLLYVAFTRPEKGLFILAPYTNNNNRTNESALSTANKLLQLVLGQHTSASGTNRIYTKGALHVSKSQQTLPVHHSLATYHTYAWRHRLVIRTSAEPETEASRQRGVKLHQLLAQLQYADQLQELINRQVNARQITPQEAEQFQAEIEKWMQQPVVASWFSRLWQVRTEVPVLIPGGAYKRIDRLMTTSTQTVVVDFKSGQHRPADEEQLREYMLLLVQMGMPQVKGYLFYTQEGRHIEITLPQKRTRPGKGHTDNQLSLDF